MSWLMIIVLGVLLWGAVAFACYAIVGPGIRIRDDRESLLPTGGVQCSNF
ncbi:hypothetical protein ACFYE2_00645 [Kocuria sp. CPCC 205300]